jgi:hypothetical protein
METVEDLIQELDEAAWAIAQVDLADQSWTILEPRVLELIDRADRVLALGHRTGVDAGPAVRWARTDPPVVLARAFGLVHRRLAAMAGLTLPAPASGVAA